MKINIEFIAQIQNHLQQLRSVHAKSIQGKPWFILLGPARSGKTSFLKNAELPVQNILSPDDTTIQTWICDNALYIDIHTRSIAPTQLQQTWEAIVRILRENKGRQKYGGLLLILPLHDLMNQTKLQRDVLINDYKTIAMNFAVSTSNPLAIYTLFSQCDRLAGFSEYFSDLDHAQRQTPCGFILKSKEQQPHFDFSEDFDQLLKSLHETLIKRLHQVQNPEERARINDFALQFESIKEIITDTIANLTNTNSSLENRGCFFISNLQDGGLEDRLSKSLEQTFTLRTANISAKNLNSQTYFSHQLAKQIIPNNHNQVASVIKQPWFSSFRGHAWTLGLTGSILLALTATFLHQRSLIQQTNLQLADYLTHKTIKPSKLTPDELRSLVESLDKLQQAETKISHSSKYWPNLFPFNGLKQTTNEFEQTYRQELSQELYTRFASFIDHKLTELGNDDPDAIYNALKAYLMLGASEHRQSDYLINWLGSQIDIKEIKEKLAPMFADNGVQVTLNQENISEARNFLADLAPATLGLAILKSQSAHKLKDNIPFIFTKEGYQSTVSKQIPEIASQILSNNWVLGPTALHGLSAEQLSEEISKQYPEAYVKWWQQFLVSVNFPVIHTLDEAISALHKVTVAQSHLVTMIDEMRQQTSQMSGTDKISIQFNKQIASQFSGFDNGSYQHLGVLSSSFKQLYNSLKAIADSNDQNAAAFQFAQHAFKQDSHSGIASLIHQSAQLPSPLNLLVMQVIDECWHVVLPKAQQHLETAWHAHVTNEYVNMIEGKYPIAPHAKTELSLSSFNHFFAPNGTLDIFFGHYLKEFVNTDSPTWQAKQLGALDFPLAPQLLEMLVRAKLIRQMFFPNQGHETRIGFKLTPLRLDPIIKDSVMDIDGQTLFATPGSSKTVHMNWPGPHSGQINVVFNNIDGSKSYISEVGPWSWFKLLSKVDIKRMESPQQFQVTFNLNGNAARYELTADTVVNPFLANIVTGFSLPADLFTRETS